MRFASSRRWSSEKGNERRRRSCEGIDRRAYTGTEERERERLFGRFEYVAAPTAGNPEAIRVVGEWKRNIVAVDIPQLVRLGLRKRPRVYAHRLVSEQLRGLWQAWEDEGVLGLVRSWNGSYAARFKRGSRSVLSNHAFGTAFDINARWNRLGAVPALKGEVGSVRELVPVAASFHPHGTTGGLFFSPSWDHLIFRVMGPPHAG